MLLVDVVLVVVVEEIGGAVVLLVDVVLVVVVEETGVVPRTSGAVVVAPRLRIAGRSSSPPQDARRAQMVTTRQQPARRIASF